MTEHKKWYIHLHGQNLGPVTSLEIASQEGFSPEALVWAAGMESWVPAKEIPEFQKHFTPPPIPQAPPASPPPVVVEAPPIEMTLEEPISTPVLESSHEADPEIAPTARQAQQEEASILTELQPHEVDDRTEAMDRDSLRQASREALVARKTSQKAKRALFSGESSPYLKSFVLFIFFGGFFYGLFASRALWVGTLWPRGQDWLERVISPLPTLEDLSPENYLILKRAAKEGVSHPVADFVLSESSIQRPVFVVGGNLPDGTRLSLYVHSKTETLLTEKEVDLQLPLVISQKNARTPPLHDVDSSTLPMGEYQVILTDDLDQEPGPKAFLAGVTLFPGSLPPFVTSSGKHLWVARSLFLGGTKDASYEGKLKELHRKKQMIQAQDKKVAEDWVSFSMSQLGLLKAFHEKVKKVTNVKYRKNSWEDLEKSWVISSIEAPSETLHPEWFQELRGIRQELLNLQVKHKELFNARVQLSHMNDLETALQKLLERFSEFKKKLGGAQ